MEDAMVDGVSDNGRHRRRKMNTKAGIKEEKVLREVRLYLQQMSDAKIIAYPSHLMSKINEIIKG